MKKRRWLLAAVIAAAMVLCVPVAPPASAEQLRQDETQITDKPPCTDGLIELTAPENAEELLVNGKILCCFFQQDAPMQTVWADYYSRYNCIIYDTDGRDGKLVVLQNRYEQGQQGLEIRFYPESDGTVTAFLCLIGGKTLPQNVYFALAGYNAKGKMTGISYRSVDQTVLNQGIHIRNADSISAFLLNQNAEPILKTTK